MRCAQNTNRGGQYTAAQGGAKHAQRARLHAGLSDTAASSAAATRRPKVRRRGYIAGLLTRETGRPRATRCAGCSGDELVPSPLRICFVALRSERQNCSSRVPLAWGQGGVSTIEGKNRLRAAPGTGSTRAQFTSLGRYDLT